MAYDLGDVVPLGVTVKDAGGTLVNAGAMALTITQPDDTTVTVSPVTPVSTGTYTYDFLTLQAGRHLVRWLATGANANAYTDIFDVGAAEPVSIVSLARTKRQLGIAESDQTYDEELRDYVTGGSKAVERQLGTIVARRSFTERRPANACGQILLSNVPVLSVTSAVSADGATTWTVANLHPEPDTGLVYAATGPALRGDVDVIYRAGLRIVPEDYQLATLIIVEHLWETRRGAMGVQLGGENEPWLPGRGFAVPRRAIELLDSTLPGIA